VFRRRGRTPDSQEKTAPPTLIDGGRRWPACRCDDVENKGGGGDRALVRGRRAEPLRAGEFAGDEVVAKVPHWEKLLSPRRDLLLPEEEKGEKPLLRRGPGPTVPIQGGRETLSC